MAPKQKITKEQLLEAAFEITRREGFSAVTARSVAEAAGCSIQPVFSQFATMDALHQAVFSYACRRFTNEIMKNKDRPDFIACTNKWVLNLARREPNLFHLLYLSDSFQGQNLWEVMMGYETNREMAAVFQDHYGLTEAECKDIFLRGYLLLHGIATMIATNHMDFSDEQAADMVKRTVADMVEGTRRRQNLGMEGRKEEKEDGRERISESAAYDCSSGQDDARRTTEACRGAVEEAGGICQAKQPLLQ